MATQEVLQQRLRIPRSKENDYSHEMATERRSLFRQETGADLSHVAKYSFDPGIPPATSKTLSELHRFPSA